MEQECRLPSTITQRRGRSAGPAPWPRPSLSPARHRDPTSARPVRRPNRMHGEGLRCDRGGGRRIARRRGGPAGSVRRSGRGRGGDSAAAGPGGGVHENDREISGVAARARADVVGGTRAVDSGDSARRAAGVPRLGRDLRGRRGARGCARRATDLLRAEPVGGRSPRIERTRERACDGTNRERRRVGGNDGCGR